ncbi:MAG TPA: M50 family metallopeptidase [Actinomycetota bacterium]|nr:M50 family metallopeptidase [Actinomycetota bacterium]
MGGTHAIIGFLALIVLVVIPIHELGHMLVAKRFGFKVTEYFVGFGPRLWSIRRGETEYGVKGIPAGGYVKIAGMNPYETVATDDLPRAYGSKPIWQRALVILAGPLSHFLVGGILYLTLFASFGDFETHRVYVGEVAATLDGGPSPARQAGLRVGDHIVRVGDLASPTDETLSPYVTEYAREHPGEPLLYVVERDGERRSLSIVPQLVTEENPATGEPETRGRIGFTLGPELLSLPEAAGLSARWVARASLDSVTTIPKIFTTGVGRTISVLFTDEPRRATDPASLWGVSRQVGDAGERGDWALFLGFAAYVTVFIGVVNLIPLPPLDGGHLLLLVWEKVTGRLPDYRRLVPVSAAVIVFLSIFAIATVFLDITEPLPGI